MLHMNGMTTGAETQHPADNGAQVPRSTNVAERRCVIRFSHAYPDFLNPGVDDLLTTLEGLA